MIKVRNWDEREKPIERINWATGKYLPCLEQIPNQYWKSEAIIHTLFELYISLVKEYGWIYDIELPDPSEDIHIYDFLNDEKFISWVFATYGVKFVDMDMFTLPSSRDDIEK